MSKHTLRWTPIAIMTLSMVLAPRAHGDEIKRFTTSATAAGVRGNLGLVFQGLAHPRSMSNYVSNAVFTDPGLPGNVVMVANNGDTTLDPVTRLEVTGADTHDVLVGRSVDGGATFYFRRVLKWDNGLRMVRVAVAPDPNRNRVWAGTGQVYINNPNSAGEAFRGTTRIEIDWGNHTVRLLDQDLVGWDEYPLGTLNPPEPGYFSNVKFTHIAKVTVGGETRFEAWATESAAPGSVTPCAGGGATATYTNNLQATGWGASGQRIAWYRFDPATGVDLGSRKLITSSVRSLPTSYSQSDRLVTRAQLGSEDYLLVGSNDQTVCTRNLTLPGVQPFDGSSIRFIKLAYDAQSGNYDEVEQSFLIDISNDAAPNWTCADGRVRCTGNYQNYSFVGAVPYQNGGQLQVYAINWGGEVPTLPAIGEAGTVQVNHNPTVVTLSRTYSNPVVFAQPLSYAGGQPAIARIAAVNGSSFTVQVQEDTGLDGTHVTETLSYVVLEAGTYRLADRRVLEVAKVTTGATVPATTSWTSSLDLRDSHDAVTGALVFTQLQTSNDPYFADTRQTASPTIANAFRCNPIGQCGNIKTATVPFGIEEDEAAQRAGGTHGTETVGVLLIGETWQGRSSSIFTLGPFGASGFDVGRVASVGGITNLGWTTVPFEAPHLGSLSSPVLLTTTETRNGGNPTCMRYRNLSETSTEMATDEDQSFDTERDHVGETVVYWVLGQGSGTIRAHPISPDADQIFH